MNIFTRLLIAVGSKEPPPKRIDKVVRYDKAECERALAEAENRLGLTYKGKGIRVTANDGDTCWSAEHWGKGKIGALTSGGRDHQAVVLYVDPSTKREHWEELVHEMAHCVLWSRGTMNHDPQYAKRFYAWRDL